MQLCHEQQIHGKDTIQVPAVENLQQINFQVKAEPKVSSEGALLMQIQQVLQNLCAVSFSN